MVTVIAKYSYVENANHRKQRKIIAPCIPNGKLQSSYNPDARNNTFWRAGRNAPTLGEDFRVRVRFDALKERASWRVVEIPLSSMD